MSKACFDMFHELSATVTEGDWEFETFTIKSIVTEHLIALSELFAVYFLSEEDPRKDNEWIRNLFVISRQNLSNAWEDQ